jgi:hypothetical protein
MATNRLYLVNTETKEYCCIAKCLTYEWGLGNVDVLNRFLADIGGISDKTPIIIGTENDSDFYEKWIKDGVNVNKEGWVYYE